MAWLGMVPKMEREARASLAAAGLALLRTLWYLVC